ncbi:hypothetical protein LINPERHAP1_LOCUS17774, partial [Linum perenne]
MTAMNASSSPESESLHNTLNAFSLEYPLFGHSDQISPGLPHLKHVMPSYISE